MRLEGSVFRTDRPYLTPKALTPCSTRNNPSHPTFTCPLRRRLTHDAVVAANPMVIRRVVHPALMVATLRGMDAIVVTNNMLAPRRNDHTILIVTPRDMYDHRIAGPLMGIVNPPFTRACMSNQTPAPVGCLWWRRSGSAAQTLSPRPPRILHNEQARAPHLDARGEKNVYSVESAASSTGEMSSRRDWLGRGGERPPKLPQTARSHGYGERRQGRGKVFTWRPGGWLCASWHNHVPYVMIDDAVLRRYVLLIRARRKVPWLKECISRRFARNA
jgi:hypothetical protein